MIWRCDLLPQYLEYKEEIDKAIQDVLHSGRYTLANQVQSFEKEFAAYLGIKNAVSVANGTDGLVLALMALGISQGDEVITTPFTAIPTVSAIIQAGATPVFVDVDIDSYLLDFSKIDAAISKKTKAVIPVHLFGNVANIKKLRELIGNEIFIIEDACQAHGSKIGEQYAGTIGDIGVFSFYPTKNLGAYGDGGMVVTNSDSIAEKLKLLRMYGMTDYNHIVINGVNSRLDELQAGILRVKLKYLDKMNKARNRIAAEYIKHLDSNLFLHQHIVSDVYSNYHVFESRFIGDRHRLMTYLNDEKIQTNIYYLMPIHLQEANRFLGYKSGDMPNAERSNEEVIALPMYPELTDETQQFIIEKINNFIKK